jgi:hypothetical protein
MAHPLLVIAFIADPELRCVMRRWPADSHAPAQGSCETGCAVPLVDCLHPAHALVGRRLDVVRRQARRDVDISGRNEWAATDLYAIEVEWLHPLHRTAVRRRNIGKRARSRYRPISWAGQVTSGR